MLTSMKARTIRLVSGSDVMIPDEMPAPMVNGGNVIVAVMETAVLALFGFEKLVRGGELPKEVGFDDANGPLEPEIGVRPPLVKFGVS